MTGIERREERGDDAAFLFDLFSATQGAAFAHLDLPLRRTLLRHLFAGQGTTQRATHPDGRFEILEVADTPAGRLVIGTSRDAIRIVDIALMPAHRGIGIGTHFLKTLQDEARAARLPLILSVLHSNVAARRLYDRLGFEPCGATDIHITMRWSP